MQTVRVSIKRTDEDIRANLFGPIQEAARQPYQLNIDPRKSWCDLSELRLTTLICTFKPCGINKAFNMLAIVDHMARIYDNEPAQSEIFLTEDDKLRFRAQQRHILMGACPNREDRKSFAPKYMCRPSLELINKKLTEWFDMEMCEENESFPNAFSRLVEYKPPDYAQKDVKPESAKRKGKKEKEDGSPVVVTNNKKKRIPTSEDS